MIQEYRITSSCVGDKKTDGKWKRGVHTAGVRYSLLLSYLALRCWGLSDSSMAQRLFYIYHLSSEVVNVIFHDKNFS